MQSESQYNYSKFFITYHTITTYPIITTYPPSPHTPPPPSLDIPPSPPSPPSLHKPTQRSLYTCTCRSTPPSQHIPYPPIPSAHTPPSPATYSTITICRPYRKCHYLFFQSLLLLLCDIASFIAVASGCTPGPSFSRTCERGCYYDDVIGFCQPCNQFKEEEAKLRCPGQPPRLITVLQLCYL